MQYHYGHNAETGDVLYFLRDGRPIGIPFDPANTDYQAFLQWIAEGNQPLPPDAPATE